MWQFMLPLRNAKKPVSLRKTFQPIWGHDSGACDLSLPGWSFPWDCCLLRQRTGNNGWLCSTSNQDFANSTSALWFDNEAMPVTIVICVIFVGAMRQHMAIADELVTTHLCLLQKWQKSNMFTVLNWGYPWAILAIFFMNAVCYKGQP